ncbi:MULTISPECIES: ABC transporter substrate-binding protein [Alcaligenes]|uniref:ABC transporter substrate-binding protein n=1 Tax=Alcaligenes TaxID=507 RepID=UPI0002AAD357|nr:MULTISPECIES: ABC transporter substrate-binding protein [Alcaligenes]EKU28350.1 family 1 extracellular solute-binding protein [Alcaligenes sp. HPC1271]ERI33216.1 ABC transporter substrate-binding protein [Alcaligenes sp. EGD-AK7]HRO19749.1 ABC transporter substrate-binding protein [Alcaligenes phenolicus]HRP14375.1 ABC transporter substrate-binding protein [Alcaligenes phenolicus]
MLKNCLLATSSALLMGLGANAHSAVELTMYYPIAVGGPLTDVVDGMIKDYQAQNPEVTVKAVYSGNYDETRVRALSALRAGEPVQLSVLGALDTHDLVEQGLVEAFSDVAQDATSQDWLKSFYPALMANGTLEGKVWGIPFQRSTIVMFYNKDMFRAAGLNPDQAPKTWDELVQTAQKLTNDQHHGLMIPSTGYPYWMFQAMALQNGRQLMNEEGTQVYFNDPKSVEALQFFHDLAYKNKVSPTGTIEWGTLRQAFVQGKTAMMWHTTGNLTAVKNEAKFDFGVAMLPAKEKAASPTGGGNFYLFKGANEEQKKAALDFVRWMTAPERAAKWSMATGYVGVSPAAYETPALVEYAKTFPQAVVARDQLAVASPEFATYETARVRELLSNAVQAVLTNAKTPKAALDEAQAAADRLLRPFN